MLSSNTMKEMLKKFKKCDNDSRNHLLCWQIPTTHLLYTTVIKHSIKLNHLKFINHINTTSSTSITQQLIQLPPLQSYASIVVQQPPTFQPDTGLVIPTFLLTDDPIARLNKAMIFLSLVYHLKFPPTNYQLQTSSNPRTQATIQNDQVTVQNVQGNIAKQCTTRKKVKDSRWFKEKMLIAQVQEAGVVLNKEQQDFLADSLEETDDYCDDEATANAIFLANLSTVGPINDDTIKPCYDSDIHSKVPYYDTYHDYDMLNSNILELGYIENIVSYNESYDELTGNNNVISYTHYMLTIGNNKDNYVPPPVQKNDMMLSIIEQMKSQVENYNMVNQESKSVNESLTSELERYKDRVRVLEYAVKDGHSEQEVYLSHELYTAISDRNRKVSEYEKQVFSQKTEMKNLNNHIAFLKNNFETLKQESSKKYEKNISEIVDLKKAKKELENIVFKVGQSAQTMHMLTKPQIFYDFIEKYGAQKYLCGVLGV
ncbi:hypothetical protein Tco_1503022 [Tanacetum coccineum]